jgi:hypothetical protein
MSVRRFTLVLFVLVTLAALFGVRRFVAPRKPAPKPATREAPSPEIPAAPTSAEPTTETTPDPGTPARVSHGGCGNTVKSPVQIALEASLRAQNADGSWGEADEYVGGHRYTRTGATALALLGLLGAGYSHLSRDLIDGVPVGDRVAKALEWLKANADGDPLNLSLAALALNEAFGITGSDRFKESAQTALVKLTAAQGADGSWGGDLLSSLWAAETLASARLGGMAVPDDAVARALPWLRGQIDVHRDSAAACGIVLLSKSKDDPSLDAARRLLVATPPDWSQQNFAYWYLGALAMFQLDGPQGDDWKLWSERIKTTLPPNQDPKGGWPGTGGATAAAVRNGMGALTLEVYYRYANIVK